MCKDCGQHRQQQAVADMYNLAVTLIQEKNGVDRGEAAEILTRDVRQALGKPPREPVDGNPGSSV